MRAPLSLLVLLLLAIPALPAPAQRAAPPLASLGVEAPHLAPADRAPALPRDTREPSTGTLLMGGVAFGALGMLAGGFLGYTLQTWTSCDAGDEFCGLGGLVAGGLLGEIAMLPLGVHLANRQRGDYSSSLGWSIGVAAAGVATASMKPRSAGTVLLAVPVAQLITVMAAERRTARQRDRARAPRRAAIAPSRRFR